MGVKIIGAWGSIAWFIFVISTVWTSDASCFDKSDKFVNHQHARRKLDDIAAAISIGCGTPEGFSYKDDKTELNYASDEEYIKTGENRKVSSKFMSATPQRSFESVRSLPEGNRNCYTLRPSEGKDTVYFIRAAFMYGNFDGQKKLPEFDLYVGVNKWDTLRFDNASHVVVKEIIHTPLTDEIYVCLLNTGKGTPFISTLELRHFHNSIYEAPSGALVLYRRLDFGSTNNQIIRYKEDKYDRMWFPYQGSFESINTSTPTDTLAESDYRLPSTVMETAVRSMNVNESLELEFDTEDPTLQFYVYMHFAELERLRENQHREFDIELNSKLLEKSVVPEYLQSTTKSTTEPVRGSKLIFSLYSTKNSTLPPILNAMEIYTVNVFNQESTDQEDVTAIMDIKLNYPVVGENWQGDPCAPLHYSWDGLNCSDNGYDPPKIISLNLSSRGLTGKILPSISKLKSLRSLDLSNNSLTGTVPEILSQLSNLTTLNLQGNKLSGSFPAALKARQQSGVLSLRIEGNPDLCLLEPCKKKERNIVIPVVAAIVCSIVILLALLAVWIYRRKQEIVEMITASKKKGSLRSKNRPFSFSEIGSITNNFKTVIGEGGFGKVYLGILKDDNEVALKVLSPSSKQGYKEFRAEAQLLMIVHHRNLVSLIGYCDEVENKALVYEYMVNGNLRQHLLETETNLLSWNDRLQVAIDASHGLDYLHNGCKPPIIHRDLKPSNFLLNENMQAKIADFGLSRVVNKEGDSGSTTCPAGTPGYMDPELYECGISNKKSDVYSFGIILFELITGQPAIKRGLEREKYILQRVIPVIERGDIQSIVDPRLQGEYDTNSAWKIVEIAMSCVRSTAVQRPDISLVLAELKECLAIEVASRRNWMTGSNNASSSYLHEKPCLDPGMEMAPSAR